MNLILAACRRIRHHWREHRTARARAQARALTPPIQPVLPPTVDTQPGRDNDLLLDCIRIYDDPAGYRRLRNAIRDIRKENEQP